MRDKWTPLHQALQKVESLTPALQQALALDETHLFNQEEKILNFCAQDCLGLAFHHSLQKSAIKFILQHGHSSTLFAGPQARLLIEKELEAKIAETLGKEASLLFPSRHAAHLAVLTALATSHSLIMLDRSAYLGLKSASLATSARIEHFDHNNLDDLKRVLEETKDLSFFTKIVVTESIFSLEGDLAPLEEIASLAARYDALLYVDDTHALGTFGKGGMGLTAHKKEVDISIGAFDFSLGASLASVSSTLLLKIFLQKSCLALRENPLPLPSLGTVDAALDLLPQLEGERKQLQQRSFFLKKELKKLGFETGLSESHLIPLILTSNEEALEIHAALLKRGILARPCLFPEVPPNSARLLFSLSCHHTPEELMLLLTQLRSLKKELNVF